MEMLRFENGDQMPMLGLGTWKSGKGEVGRAVKIALNAGFRHIDCAATYGNEAEIGEALSEIFSEGILKREEVWITSKLWNDSHKKEDVIPALKKSLQDLQLDYLDLYLIHWPVAFKKGVGFPKYDDGYIPLDEAPLSETWEMLIEAKNQGLVKHIGVSNFSRKKLENLMGKTEVRPEMNQVELHPYLQQKRLLQFCKKQEIHLTAFSPLGSSDRIDSMKAPDEPSLLDNNLIKKIAKKHQATPGQVLIKWHIKRDTSVIPKSTSEKHILENLESLKVELDDMDMKEIESLDRHFRYVTGQFFVTEGNSYENIYDDDDYKRKPKNI